MASQPQDVAAEDFSYETRLVVLSFMSLLPTDLVSQSSSTSGSLLSSGSSLERQKRSSSGKSSPEGATSAGDSRHERSSSDNWQHALPSLPETTLVERVMNHDKIRFVAQGGSLSVCDDPPVVLPKDEDEPDIGVMPKQFSNENTVVQMIQSDGLHTEESHKPFYTKRGLPSKGQRPVAHMVERQTSNVSASSDLTDASELSSLMTSIQSTGSRASSFIDIQSQGVDQLVQQGLLPPRILPLRDELNHEMDEMRKIKSRASLKLSLSMAQAGSTSHTAALTPESEVAEHLRLIGDFVQKEYGSVIEKAISTMVTVPNEKLTYEYMEAIITEVVQHFPDIPQRIAVLMLLTQKLAMCGKDVHRLVDFTVTFLMKKMARYILNHGGWSSIAALEVPDSPVSPSNITTEFPMTDEADGSNTDDVTDGALHDASTSNTLVSDHNGDTDAVTSVADSGFPSAASSDQLVSSTVVQGLSRDATLDSISSLSHDVTPLEALTARNLNTGVVNNNTKSPISGEGGLDPSVAVVRQGQLLRQVSEAEPGSRKEHFLTNLLQMIAVATLGSVCVVFTAVVVYKKLARR